MRVKMPHCGQKIILIASRTLENQVSNRCEENENPTPVASKRTPWNKGELTGAKPPLPPKHVWSIRTDSQRRQASQPAGAGANQIRTGDQSENREGAWPHDAALAAGARR